MSYNVTSNKSGSRVTIHCTNTASIVIPGNSLQSNIASVGETLTGAYITQIQYACPPEQYIRISRGGYLVGVFESSNFIDFAGAGMPLSKGADKDLLIEFIGLGAEKGFCNIELKKVFTELDLPEPAPEPPVPAFSLNFLNPVLDPRVTFSRGTPATLIDRTGRLTYAPNNLLLRSEEFDNAANWITVSTAITANVAVAPNGTQTADKLYPTVSAGRLYQDATTVGASVFSFYAKAAEMSVVNIRNPANSPSAIAYLDLNTGVISGVSAASASAVSVGNGWWRFSIIFATAITNVSLAPCDAAGSTVSTVSGTNGIFVWGAQVEAVTYQTTPSAYVATTASAYYGPRFDYDPVTLAPRGLLIEEARTNLFTYSEQFDQGIWAKGNSSITVNATASPDGNTTADKLIDNATNATHNVTQSFSSTSGTSYTFTIYAKAAELIWMAVQFNSSIFADGLARTAYVNLSTGAVGTVSNAPTVSVANAGNGWRRVSITATASVTTASGSAFVYLANADNGAAYAGTGTSGIYIWGAQLEAGSFATSYIPTVASTVTRNADIATVTGTNFSSWYNQSEGTIVWSGDFATLNSNRLVSIDAGVGGRTADIYATGPNAISYYKSSDGQQLQIGDRVIANTIYNVAVAIKANDYIGALNGATGGADTATSGVSFADRLSIGHWNNSSFLNGHIRVIDYYNTRLPGVQMQTLSAPSLTPTLSLDFTSGNYNVGF